MIVDQTWGGKILVQIYAIFDIILFLFSFLYRNASKALCCKPWYIDKVSFAKVAAVLGLSQGLVSILAECILPDLAQENTG